MNENKICVLVFPAGEVNSVELHDALFHGCCIFKYLYHETSMQLFKYSF